MEIIITLLNAILIYYLMGVIVYNIFEINIVIEPLYNFTYFIKVKLKKLKD